MFHQDIGNENFQVNFGISHSMSMLLGFCTHQCLGGKKHEHRVFQWIYQFRKQCHHSYIYEIIYHQLFCTISSYKRPTWKRNSPMNTCRIQHFNHSLGMCCIHFISCFRILYYSINVGVLGTPLLVWTMTKEVDLYKLPTQNWL